MGEVYVQYTFSAGDPSDLDELRRNYIKSLQTEITSLRAQVETLSQYPEEAMKALWIDGALYGSDGNFEAVFEERRDKLAAIFKEKQGVGK